MKRILLIIFTTIYFLAIPFFIVVLIKDFDFETDRTTYGLWFACSSLGPFIIGLFSIIAPRKGLNAMWKIGVHLLPEICKDYNASYAYYTKTSVQLGIMIFSDLLLGGGILTVLFG